MKKIFVYAAALAVLASCGLKEEFEPVFTGKYPAPAPYQVYDDSDFGKIMTIAELAAQYKIGEPMLLGTKGSAVIKGVVSTTDQPGNFYKSFYIQDATGGIEIKAGKNGLYNDYLPGQTVYVDCEGLTLGMYGYKDGSYGGMGMVQLGFSDPSGSYETSYLESPLLIDSHLFRGDPTNLKKVTPYALSSASELPDAKTATQATSKLIGSLVTLKGLTYGKEVFCLLYLDSKKDKSSPENRVFLSSSNNSADHTCGITTLAMSKEKMVEYIKSGVWDVCKVGSGSTYPKDENGQYITLGSLKGDGTYPTVEKAAYSVSQYFKLGSTDIQIRTSGFSKFGDLEIPKDVLDGTKKINCTGVLTLYQGSFQVVVNSQADFTYEDGTPLYK